MSSACSSCPRLRRSRSLRTLAYEVSDIGSGSYVHSVAYRYRSHMDSVTSDITTRQLRSGLAEVLGRAGYGGERIGVTRNGKLAAVVIGVADLEALEEFEMAQDVAAYEAAKAEDDGTRVGIHELRRDLAT